MRACRAIVLALLLAGGGTAQAALEDEIQGLVLDRTLTPGGQLFYQRFVAHWREQTLVRNQNITVSERPTARWGSMVTVYHGQQPLFQSFIRTGGGNIDEVATAAVPLVAERIIRNTSALTGSPDLADDEL